MRRRLPEVLASQRKMLERRGEPTDTIPDEKMAALFDEAPGEDRGLDGGEPNMSVLYVPYHELAEHPRAHVDQIIAFLGLDLDRAKMLAGRRSGALPQPRLIPATLALRQAAGAATIGHAEGPLAADAALTSAVVRPLRLARRRPGRQRRHRILDYEVGAAPLRRA